MWRLVTQLTPRYPNAPIKICWRFWLPLQLQYTDGWWSFLLETSFLFSYKDISVHNIVQYNSSFCIVNTVIWWWYLQVYVFFLSETHVVCIFIYIYLFPRLFWKSFMHLYWYMSIWSWYPLYAKICLYFSLIILIPIKGFLLLFYFYYIVDLTYIYIYIFLVWSE